MPPKRGNSPTGASISFILPFTATLFGIVAAIFYAAILGHPSYVAAFQSFHCSVISNPLSVSEGNMPALSTKPDFFVDRASLSQPIRNYLGKNGTCQFPIVFGSKGSGKSELVNHALQNRPRVFHLNIQPNEKRDVQQVLADKLQLCEGFNKPLVVDRAWHSLAPLLAPTRFHAIWNRIHLWTILCLIIWLVCVYMWGWAAWNSRAVAGIFIVTMYFSVRCVWTFPLVRPVIVIDVLHDASEDTTASVIRGAQDMACDGGNTMYVIVVLSDATSGFTSMGWDEDRLGLVYIDQFTQQEAHEYFDKRGILMGNEGRILREELFNNVGMLPVRLNQFAKRYGQGANNQSVADFVAIKRRHAEKILLQWETSDENYIAVLRAIQAAQDTNGRVPLKALSVGTVQLAQMIRNKGDLLLIDDKGFVQPRTMAEWHAIREWTHEEKNKMTFSFDFFKIIKAGMKKISNMMTQTRPSISE